MEDSGEKFGDAGLYFGDVGEPREEETSRADEEEDVIAAGSDISKERERDEGMR